MGAVKPRRATWCCALMPSIPPPVPARRRSREAHRQDLSACHSGRRRGGRAPRTATRCMTPNQGSAHREGRAGTAGHGDTVAEASIRHPRSKVPEREVEQTHIAVSQQSRNRRHERRTALRSSREQRFGQCMSRCDERGPAVHAGTEPCGGLSGCPSRRLCAIRQALRDDISSHLGDRARHPPR